MCVSKGGFSSGRIVGVLFKLIPMPRPPSPKMGELRAEQTMVNQTTTYQKCTFSQQRSETDMAEKHASKKGAFARSSSRRSFSVDPNAMAA